MIGGGGGGGGGSKYVCGCRFKRKFHVPRKLVYVFPVTPVVECFIK